MKILTKLYKEFFESESFSGFLLIIATGISLLLANSLFSESYLSLWHYKLGLTLEQWISDGLMTLFFLLIGLEIERELYIGELSEAKNALLPVIAAVGGMVVPALIHYSLNANSPTQAGAGIPMATDIAFSLTVLSLLGKRVPLNLKIFLTALAIIDDLGAILVIALAYSQELSFLHLFFALAIFFALVLCNRKRVCNLWVYSIGGLFLWYFMMRSGVHATLSGVLLAFAVPFGKGDSSSPSYKLQHALHKPVAFLILPLFALANAALILSGSWYETLLSSNSLGILLGLVLGKPLGILLFCYVGVKLGITTLIKELSWKHITGAGIVAGIGFTMSIFITLLAFKDPSLIQQSKIAILCASLFAGILGYFVLRLQGSVDFKF